MTPQEDGYFEKFLLSLKEVNIHIAIQSVLDALDIWLSCIKYYFEIVFPNYLGLNPNDTMKTWMSSPDGLIIFLVGGALMAAFSFFGNYYDSENPKSPEIIYQKADAFWPYFRDAFKGFKWTFKASRNVLEVLGTLVGLGLLGYTNIFGITLGIVAALNRLWYRGQVEKRKSFQSQNEDFNRHVFATSLAFKKVEKEWFEQLKKLPEYEKSLFKGTIFKVDNQFYTMTSEMVELSITADSDKKAISEQEMQFLQSLEHDKLDYLHYSKLLPEKDAPNLKTQLDEKNHLSKIDIEKLDLFRGQQNSGWMFSSAFVGGMFNAPYYFLGLVTTLTIPPDLYLYFFGICTAFMILNIIGELYQEFDYQRRLNVSANKSKLTLTNQLIAFELDKLNEYLDNHFKKSQLSDDEKKAHISAIIQSLTSQDKLKNLNLSSLLGDASKLNTPEPLNKKDILNAILRIDGLLGNYIAIRQQLKSDTELSKSILLWQGVRNGLQLYGVLNGIILAINVVAPLFNWSMPLYFFYGNFLFATLFVMGMMIYTYHRGQAKPDLSTQKELDENDQNFKNTTEKMPYLMPASLCKELDSSVTINPSKNLMVGEQAEVFRQFTSGFRKGIKFLSTTKSLDLFSNPNNPIYFLVGLVYGLYFCFKGLRGLMRVENNEYKRSPLLSSFFTPPPDEKPAPIHPLISNNSLLTPNIKHAF